MVRYKQNTMYLILRLLCDWLLLITSLVSQTFLSEQTFFKETLTWFEAQRCCSSRLGQLASIDDADGEIVSCYNIPLHSNGLEIWTGNIRRHSEWIEFQGTFNISFILIYAWKSFKYFFQDSYHTKWSSNRSGYWY